MFKFIKKIFKKEEEINEDLFKFFTENDKDAIKLFENSVTYYNSMMIMDICKFKKFNIIYYYNGIGNILYYISLPENIVYKYIFNNEDEMKEFEDKLKKGLNDIGLNF